MESATTTNFAHHLKIPLHEVLDATNSFDRNNIIGHGGLGVAYKGQLPRSGELMKIAALRLHHNQGKDVEFWTEISVLSDLKHTNLVPIIAFCDEKNEKIIVLTRAAKGSLKEHLDSSNLTWTQRLKICLGMARAMSYLHHEEGRAYGVIHRNINSTTVLLDENWEAKLSGFKVSIKQSANRITDQVILADPVGTIAYMDPQIETTGGVTHKSDIYAFGVVLFEVVCGRRAYIKDDANRFLTQLVKHHHKNNTMLDIVHPSIMNQFISPYSLIKCWLVAYSCLEEERVTRPDARKIVEELEKALELQLWLENLGNNLLHLKISLNDIKLATNNFSATCRFGSNNNIEFYEARLDHFGKEEPSSVEMKSKGELSKSNDTVIIKRFLITDIEQEEELFSTEIELLTSVKHHNIVTVVGFCVEGFERVLVTESFSKGYLSNYLGNVERMSILTWEKRLKICIDVAQALHYLHFKMEDKKVIIHGWINSGSIGFKENWRAKIDEFAYGGFWATNQEDKVPRKKSVSYLIYYADPDYVKELNYTLKFKREADVYSFGVVLFEILCGRKASDPIYLNESDKGLAILAKQSFCMGSLENMIDPILKGESDGNNMILDDGPNKDSFDTFCKIAYNCVANTQDKRPTMKVVVKELEKSLFFQENKKKNLRMSLEDIRLATQNFHDENSIGGGSFGKVYRGKVPQGDGFYSIVAKRLDTRPGEEGHQFLNELQILKEYKHDNIINLVGYCDEKVEKVIVYEYSSSSLEGHINDASLTWMKRLNICIGVASALDFLHEGIERDANMLIHGDIKSANILLNDDWKAKLAGFGSSLISPLNQETDFVYSPECGTLGYLDPLYIKSRVLTKESDVYSFGVVLFEILCGRTTLAIHEQEGHYLPDFVRNNFEEGKHDELVFGQIKEQIERKSLDTFQTIAYQCLHHEKEKRPTTKEILIQLKKALEFQEGTIQSPSMDHLENKLKKLQLTREAHGKKFEHLKIRLSDIKLATHTFSPDYIIATRDAYTMYRAELDLFGKENPSSEEGEDSKGRKSVIITRYSSVRGVYGEENFFTEIEMLTAVKHDNIVNLLGYCFEAFEMILITEDLSYGYLVDYLKNVDIRGSLTWEIRLQISSTVACALNYLHHEIEDQKVIINRQISSLNIGLDEGDGAKIFDFGLSIFLPPNQKDEALYVDGIGGIEAYIDPEYKKTCRLKRESDVYSFGVLLFEILFGTTAFDPRYETGTGGYLAHVARQSYRTGTLEEKIDPIIKEETSENNSILNRGPDKDSLRTYIEIAYKCVAESQDKRPTMKEVVKELEKALSFQANKDKLGISLEVIEQATRNFSHRIGGGGFGNVYIGNLKGETIVAKRLDTRYGQGKQQFLTELQILLEYKHENIIGLIGYCDENDESIIVYEYASRGSLDKYLKNADLTWIDRLNICIDVARALDFLHGVDGKQAKVIHRDIKTANILLNTNWKAKLADFGLSLISPIAKETEYVIDYVCGTEGYLDPLYKKSKFLTIESDIYSFGVVLFEILCGKSTSDVYNNEHCYLQDFVKESFAKGKLNEMVFEKIRKPIQQKSLTIFQNIAYQCLHDEREERPTIKKVFAKLENALEIQNMASTMTKFTPLQITLKEVVAATNNFHVDNIIGQGKFGTTYIGQLLRSGKEIKIVARRFDCKHGEVDLKFLREISVLYDLKHTNLVSIVGFCDEQDEKIIVTMYEANKSLAQYLNNLNLTWTQRLRISVGIARALSYLHDDKVRDYAIIHCNINSNTILLDENWEAKLSSFEVSIKQPTCDKDCVHHCEHIGTTGCMDPTIEKAGGVTHKSDIYSFGIVLFEMLCGRKAFIQDEANNFLAPLAKYHYEKETLQEIIHPCLQPNQMSAQSLFKYSNIAYLCLKEDRADRPDIDFVVREFEKALELQLRRESIENKFKHLKIPLNDIKLATNNFSDTYKTGSWNQYTFYRAELDNFDKENPSYVKEKNTVFIKRYPSGNEECENLFYTEIEKLSGVKHPNIVTLLGFCVDASEMIIVTENFSNGHLDGYFKNVNDVCILTWEKRLKICVDVAHALKYLHFEMEDQNVIIHRDIYSRSIMLGENWGAKIGDFGGSVFLPPNQQDEALYLDWRGRSSYTDPEYKKTNKLKRESDVYSFGVVLLEILTGKVAYEAIFMKEGAGGLASMARRTFLEGTLEDMMDPILKEETNENNFVKNGGPNKNSLHTFMKIAVQCVAETQDQRPNMKVVVKELHKALFFQVDGTASNKQGIYSLEEKSTD